MAKTGMARWLSGSPTAMMPSVVPLQFAGEPVEELDAAGLALLRLLDAVEELALLGVDDAGAAPGREQLGAGERGGDAPVADLHRVREDNALPGNDVLVDGVVGDERSVLEAEAAGLAAADAEVGVELVDLPALSLREPAALAFRIGEGGEDPRGGGRLRALDDEGAVDDR